MFLDLSIEAVISLLGHDGSVIVDSSLPEPYCRRGFCVGEIVKAVKKIGIQLQTNDIQVTDQKDETIRLYTIAEVDQYLKTDKNLLLYGLIADQVHAVAYHNSYGVFDPNGTVYSVKEFDIFSIIERM